MDFAFAYSFDLSSDKKILKFGGRSGEEYALLHELTWTIYGNSILNMTLECNIDVNALIVAELCSTGVSSVKATALLEDCRASLTFQNVNFLTADPWRCVLRVVPHLQLRNLHEPPTATPSAIVPSRRNAVRKLRLENLSSDLQNVLSTGELSDVVLSDGRSEILAHKVILSARSLVFAKMFQHKMKESCENRVTITDISQDVLRDLIHFIYTGTIAVKDSKMARELYVAADKYAVADLKRLCSEVLQSVTFDDVLDTLALADLHEDRDLKHSALRFIALNYSHVKSSKNWEGFMKENQGLAIEILSFIIENKL